MMVGTGNIRMRFPHHSSFWDGGPRVLVSKRPASGSNSAGRVSASQAGCRGFESRLPLHFPERDIGPTGEIRPAGPSTFCRGHRGRASPAASARSVESIFVVARPRPGARAGRGCTAVHRRQSLVRRTATRPTRVMRRDAHELCAQRSLARVALIERFHKPRLCGLASVTSHPSG